MSQTTTIWSNPPENSTLRSWSYARLLTLPAHTNIHTVKTVIVVLRDFNEGTPLIRSLKWVPIQPMIYACPFYKPNYYEGLKLGIDTWYSFYFIRMGAKGLITLFQSYYTCRNFVPCVWVFGLDNPLYTSFKSQQKFPHMYMSLVHCHICTYSGVPWAS